MPLGEMLIDPRTSGFPLNLLNTEFADLSRWRTCPECSGGERGPLAHKGHRAHNTIGANLDIIHQYGIHADQGIAANCASMHDCAVADMAILRDYHIFVGIRMHDTGVLHVAAPHHLDA